MEKRSFGCKGFFFFERMGSDWTRRALTEAEEERVHTHVVHTEEPVGDHVAAEHDRLRGGTGSGFELHVVQSKASYWQPLTMMGIQ